MEARHSGIETRCSTKEIRHIKRGGRPSEGDVEDHADVPNTVRGEVLEDRYEIQQLIVVRVREPAANR